MITDFAKQERGKTQPRRQEKQIKIEQEKFDTLQDETKCIQ